MQALLVIGLIFGWLAAGILVNRLLDYSMELLDKDDPVRTDGVGVVVAIIAWPVVLLFMTAIGLMSILFFLATWKPGKRSEHSE